MFQNLVENAIAFIKLSIFSAQDEREKIPVTVGGARQTSNCNFPHFRINKDLLHVKKLYCHGVWGWMVRARSFSWPFKIYLTKNISKLFLSHVFLSFFPFLFSFFFTLSLPDSFSRSETSSPFSPSIYLSCDVAPLPPYCFASCQWQRDTASVSVSLTYSQLDGPGRTPASPGLSQDARHIPSTLDVSDANWFAALRCFDTNCAQVTGVIREDSGDWPSLIYFKFISWPGSE